MEVAPHVDDSTRLALRNRPVGRAAGYQQWRDLLFIHWQVPADALARQLPPGLQPDTHNGAAWLGLVPFEMSGVRPWWFPAVPGISNFPETNLRTYVVCRGEPGVYFFSLEAARAVAVWVARRRWHLPYYRAQMELIREGNRRIYRSVRRKSGGRRHHQQLAWAESEHPHRCHVAAQIGAALDPPEVGSLEFFLVERYLLFAPTPGCLLRGQVYHPPYPLREATLTQCDETLSRVLGLDPLPPPQHVLYSSGVDVEVFPLRPAGSADRVEGPAAGSPADSP